MKLLDERGIGTVWSICKEKFALTGHTHNSLVAVGNESITTTTYGSGLHFKPYYNSGGPTTYGNILEYTSTNTGGGQLAMEWTGSQTKSDGTDSNVGRVYYRSKRDNIDGWTKWMTLAYTNDIPTKLSQLNNDKGFVTGSVSGNTVTINGVSTTWTNTWRGIQDNLTSSSTSDSLSANQGKVLKGLVDGKANSSHTHTWSQISGVPTATTTQSGIMSAADKSKLNGIESGANNYSLPTSSSKTLGGIRTSSVSGSSYEYWPIIVDNSGYAYASIDGLYRNSNGSAGSISVKNGDHIATYGPRSIGYVNTSQNKSISFSFPFKSGTLAITSDIPTKTSQLINDSTFLTSADKYTLPVASNTTLGGIKVSANASGTGWPICVDSNGLAETKIAGLSKVDNMLYSVILSSETSSTYYNANEIAIEDRAGKKHTNIAFPSKSGIFALLSDIPDVSNLCKFNFINSISECKGDRINFLLGFTGNIDLTPLFSCDDGTILLMVTSDDISGVSITSGNWNIYMEDYTYNSSTSIYKGQVHLATVYNSKIFFLKLG